MKSNCFTLQNSIFIFFPLLILFVSCKEDDDQPQIDPLDQLPPPTQEGLRTFGALFNGEPFTHATTLDVRADFSGKSFLAVYMGNNDDPRDPSFVIFINNYDEKEGTYLITPKQDSLTASSDLTFKMGNKRCWYEEDEVVSGFINITKFDKINRICSGNFEYTAVNEDCDTVRITHGRFDTWIDL